MRPRNKLLLLFSVILLLSSCKEYEPVIECNINGTPVVIKGFGTVLAQYVNMGSYTISSVGADGEDYDINIRFNSNVPDTYLCGENKPGTIEVYYNFNSYTTNAPGGSGTIEVVQAGANLIEGHFHGSLWNDGVEMVITDGLFSGRAF
jgi:hypothetical protein